jgi:hypothetical protein
MAIGGTGPDPDAWNRGREEARKYPFPGSSVLSQSHFNVVPAADRVQFDLWFLVCRVWLDIGTLQDR